MPDNKICPKCNTENPIAANFCRKCRYEFPEETKNGQSLTPIIKDFSILEDVYVSGSTIHLRWDVENYTKLELNGEDVTNYDNAEYFVDKVEKISLIAYNDYDQVRATLNIKPNPIPKINRFSSNSTRVRSGQKIKLSWDIKNHKRVFLNDGDQDIDVTGKFKFEVQPLDDTLYTLRCSTDDPYVFVEKQISVNVIADIIIKKFVSDASFIIESEQVVLSWEVKNADQVFLYPNSIEVTGKTEIRLSPNRTTEYRLIARNSISEKQETLSVCVKPLPKIDLKLDNVMSGINIPQLRFSTEELLPDISEIHIDKIINGEEMRMIENDLSAKSIFKKINALLHKGLK